MPVINYIEKHTKTFTVNQHKHQHWEIIYVTDGQGHIETENGESLSYAKGETICIPPNLLHKNHSKTGFKNLHLTIENWNAPIQKLTLIPAANNSEDLNMLLEMAYKYFHLTSIKSDINFALTNSIVAHLDFLISKPQGSGITQIIESEIIKNYTDVYFDLEKVYDLMPYSKEYARKMFVKEHKISPLKFLMQKRVALAVQLLSKRIDNNYSIREIAESCGFSDQLYFSRYFKKVMKINPQAYRLVSLNNNKIFDTSDSPAEKP